METTTIGIQVLIYEIGFVFTINKYTINIFSLIYIPFIIYIIMEVSQSTNKVSKQLINDIS
jgi:hypothetical protein